MAYIPVNFISSTDDVKKLLSNARWKVMVVAAETLTVLSSLNEAVSHALCIADDHRSCTTRRRKINRCSN
jgi:hypothetical protein